MRIFAEAALEPVDFFENSSIFNRERTEASVAWELPALADDEPVVATPDVSPLFHELRDDHGFDGCGYFVFILETTSGDQNYVSYDADPASAPVLTITYEFDG